MAVSVLGSDGKVSYLQLEASSAKTTSGNSGALTLPGVDGNSVVRLYLNVSAVTAGTTLDVKLQDSADGVVFVDVASGAFAQVTTAAADKVLTMAAQSLSPNCRLVWTVVGTSYTFSVKAAVLNK